MTIPLPTLPSHPEHCQSWTHMESRAIRKIQREAMRVAIEAAAKVCRDFDATDSLSNYGLVLARMIEELEIA